MAGLTGGTITTNGTKTVHTFTESGTFTVPTGVSGNIECLIVAGGGGGGSKRGGGGGAGGLVYDSSHAVTAQSYGVVIGAGGAGSDANTANATAGSNSTFASKTATGGGKGGGYNGDGGAGGCGGGAGSGEGGAYGGGVGSQGYDGGDADNQGGGGGGGMGAVGADMDGNLDGDGGNGGNGLAYSISGSSTYYAGGGGGGADTTSDTGGSGGLGGGGDGGDASPYDGEDGTANTGGGGGGGGDNGSLSEGGNGGSGIVIISYITADFTLPDAPTNVSATDGSHTDKVVITWTKSSGATGYKVYRGATLVDTLGDVATYDDTGADVPTLTAGTTTATDGTYVDKVTLAITGNSVANGTSHSYTVKAVNAAGDSDASTANTGYRGHGSVYYQWQRSSGTGDSDYSNIGSNTTTEAYNDTAAPAPSVPGTPTSLAASDGTYTDKVSLTWTNVSGSAGAVRCYKCVQTCTGCSSVTSTYNSGYRKAYTSTNVQVKRDSTEITALGSLLTSYNDTGADAPVITPGTAVASDGVYIDKVSLSISGESVANGTTHNYYVRSYNAAGWGSYCSTNTGYRDYGSLTYQWKRSDADSDADYNTNLGTTESYDDTTAPEDASGRYYVCVLDAAGAAQQTTSADRGFRLLIVEIIANIDALIKKTLTKESSIDALIQKALTETNLIDALLAASFSENTSIDSLLGKRFTKTSSLDAFIADYPDLFIDALIQKSITSGISIDTLLQKLFSVGISVDAIVYALITKTSSIDALLQKRLTKTSSIDALLQKELVEASFIDALLQMGLSKDIAIDVLLGKRYIKTTSFDAIFGGTASSPTSLDALLEYTYYEMWDYLSTVSPDSDYTLDIKPTQTLVEEGAKNAVIHLGDDGSEERIALDDDSIFYVSLQWSPKNETDSGTIFDFFNSTSKGCGTAKSFKWVNYGEPLARRHTYVVRFATDLSRSVKRNYVYGVSNVKLEVLGRV